MSEDEEECESCKHAVAVGMSLNICKDVESELGIDCDQLAQDIQSGKRKPLDVVRQLAKTAKKRGLSSEAGELEHLIKLTEE